MRIDELPYLPFPTLPAPRAGDGAGTMLATLSARTALSRSGRSRSLLSSYGAGVPLQGEVLTRQRVADAGVDSYLALGRVAPSTAIPRSLFVDLYA
jgi:hypothetical protein